MPNVSAARESSEDTFARFPVHGGRWMDISANTKGSTKQNQFMGIHVDKRSS